MLLQRRLKAQVRPIPSSPSIGRPLAAGLLRGAYHFFHADQDAVAQANHFLQVAELPGDLPPVIDVESDFGASNTTMINGVQAWLDTVAQSVGRAPMVYTTASFWNAHLNSDFGSYPLWIARYSQSEPVVPTGWTTWNFWQYSQSGTVNGVSGDVDLDYFAGSIDALMAFAQSGQSAQSNTPDAVNTSTGGNTDIDQSITTSDQSGGGYTYIVKPGDTLSEIAASFNTSVEALQQANNTQNPNEIEVGQILTIPE